MFDTNVQTCIAYVYPEIHILFLCKKIEQTRKNLLYRLMYVYKSSSDCLSLFSCCCTENSSFITFSLSANNLSTKLRIASPMFILYSPLSALQKELAFPLRKVAYILLYFLTNCNKKAKIYSLFLYYLTNTN